MQMGSADKNSYDIINNYEEKNLANIIYQYGEERYSRVIAKEIVKNRKIKYINDTLELSNIIKNCLPKKNKLKNKIHPATKTFQAIRIYVNDELSELKTSLEKTLKILNKDGLILVVSFQSLEDRIVKDFFNHNSGKRWRSSRHYPELPDKLATQLKIITKKPILPSASEILENPRSRSAKLRVAQKI
jgi:16S rRNA (cytosine1402-N4)-methyltransferase